MGTRVKVQKSIGFIFMAYFIFRQKTLGVKGGAAAIDSIPDNMGSLAWITGNVTISPTNPAPLTLDLALESGSFRGAIIDGLVTLYHKKLCAVLTDFGIDNIQYFPVVLRNKDTGKTEDDYFLVNIIGLLDCVDMNKSKVKWWPSGMGFDFISMVIDENKTQGLPVFRLKEDPTKVLISEALKKHLQKNKVLVGTQLIKPEDYSDW